MTEILSQIAVISKDAIEWIDNLNGVLCSVDTFEIVDKKLTFLSEKPYDILLLVDENPFLELSSFINQITRSYPLISIVVLVSNNDPDYTISLTEQGVDAVLDRQEDPSFLTRRLSHAIKRNQAKQMAIQHNRHLNSVTILSRQLHNENESNKLIIDTLNIVTATFDLMGLAIVLESGGQYHLRAGRAQNGTQQSIYDVITHLHPYDPLRHAMEKGIVMVFEDLSLNDYMVNIPIFDELHSAIVVPLRYVNITIGSLMAFGKDRNQLTRNDIVIYEHLATHLGSAYQNVRYSQTQDVSVRTNRHLLRTWQRLSPLYAPEEVNKTIKTLASEIPAVKHALAWLYDESKSLPIVHTSNLPAIQIFEKLYEQGIIGEYVNQFDTQLRPITVWLGPPSTQNIGELFQVMGGQQLIFVPIKDEARLLGCLLVSSNSNEKMSPENIDLLEGITYAAGQTLERNLFMQYQDQQTERLEAITRSIRDGIFFVDESQTIVFCNPQFTELTGINLSLVINQHIDHLIDNLVTQCDDPATARQLLDDAVQQMTNYLPDQDYPIVEISLPAIDTKLYIEFMTLTQDSNYNHQSWIGVIHSGNSLMIAEHNTPSALIGSILDHLQDTSRNIYRDLIPLNRVNTKESEKVVKQITQHGHEIEQLLIIAEKFMELEQSTHLAPSSTDPNQLLSIILNKPPLLQYDNQLDVRVALRDTQIYVDRNYMMQAMTSLIEVGISLSNSPLVLVQMGSRAQQFVFRVVSQGTATSIVSLQSALTMPDVHIEDVDYATQLRLYFVQQVIDRQDGQVVIKKSKGESIQFDILLTVEENKTDGIAHEKIERIPERKLSKIMILDDYQYPSDVDYQALTDNEYDIFFSNTIEQVFEELDLFRIDAVILTLREDHEHKISIVQQLRNKKNTTIPIMMLSTYNTEDIRVKALRAGVDAFVSLPISNSEFLAQVENLFERAKLPERVHEPVVIGELQIDFAQRHVTLEDKNVSLTRIEYELLVLLALNLGQTLTHNKLLTEVWGPEYRDEKQYLWVNMSRLRRKLEKTVSRKRYIFTQPGIGYILRDM